MYSAALIGCGKIGSEFADDPYMSGDVFTHAEAYTRCSSTNLVAICDSNLEKLAKCGQRWNVKNQYSQMENMLESENPDIISICTPDNTHYQLVKTALEKPSTVKAILCEKPLANTIEEASHLVSLAEERSIILAVEYMRRYAININTLRAFIQRGNIGVLQGITGWYSKGVLHNGTHWFDMLRFLFGEVEWVLAQNGLDDQGDDPTLDVTLKLNSGPTATLRACDSTCFSVFEMDIMGRKGRIQILDSGFQILSWQNGPSPRYSDYVELLPRTHDFGHRKNLLQHAVEDLISSLQNGHQPACTGQDGLETLRIGWAAIESERTGEIVYLRQEFSR